MFKKIKKNKIIRKIFKHQIERKKKKTNEAYLAEIKLLPFLELSNDEKRQIDNYWKKYVDQIDYRYWGYYKGCGLKFNPKMIPANIFFGDICSYYNKQTNSYFFDDKNMYDLYFSNVTKKPKTFIRKIHNTLFDREYRIITKEKALAILNQLDDYILKKASNTWGGSNIFFRGEKTNDQFLDFILNSDDDWIVQEVLKNHDCFKLLAIKALSTLRVYTLETEHGLKIISSFIRVPLDSKSRVDNMCSGGGVIKVFEGGILGKNIFSIKNGVTKYNGQLKQIPFYEESINFVMGIDFKFPMSRLIAWDLAITNEGPFLVEINLGNCDINLSQFTSGEPFFEDYTDDVLDEVFLGSKH